jgi:FkbM family methyltransferase
MKQKASGILDTELIRIIIVGVPRMITCIPRPLPALLRTIRHRILYGNWYEDVMILVRREFNVWLYAFGNHLIDACLLDEPKTWNYVKELVIKGKVASMLDVGAHIGAYSVVLGRKIPVVAMEPMPDTYAMLNLNVKLNEVNVRAIRAAAYNARYSIVKLRRSSSRSGDDFVSSEGNIEAPAYTLDDVWDKHGPFDLVKIDVQGSEVEVLEGFSQVPKYLVIEVRRRTLTAVKSLLLKHLEVLSVEKLVRADEFNIIAKKKNIV